MEVNGGIFKHEVLILETHLDLLGHVNNATYLQLFEEARWELIANRNFGIPEITKLKIGPVILECTIRFLKELKVREKITVTVQTLDYKDKIGHLKQQMIRPDGAIASEAIFTFALFDLSQRKLILPTPEWLYALGLSKA